MSRAKNRFFFMFLKLGLGSHEARLFGIQHPFLVAVSTFCLNVHPYLGKIVKFKQPFSIWLKPPTCPSLRKDFAKDRARRR